MNVFELTLKLQGFKISKAEKVLANILKMSAPQLYQWQNKKKWEIFNHHLNHNPFYKKFLGNNKPEKWEDIPIINKKDLQKPIAEMMSEGFSNKNVYLSNTSGSSGHPFFFAKDKFCHALTWALIKDRYARYNIQLNSSQIRFYGIPLDKKSYWHEKLKDKLSNRIRLPVFDLSDEVLEYFISVFKKNKIQYIYGYTSSVVYFAKYLNKKEITLKTVCPSLKVCIVTSELCTPEDKAIIEKALGIRVAIEYGSSELSIMGFELPDGEMICSDEITFFENVTEENGTTRLLCTSLHNKAFPLIRYDIGDSVMLDHNKEGRKIIKVINGRVNDFAKLPSGKIAAGLTFYYISRTIMESTTCVKEFIIRQTKLDTFELDMVTTEKLSSDQVVDLKEKVEMYLEPGLTIKISYVDKIKRKANGKIQHFYSELTD